jgi:hypothetical protein
MDSGFYIFELVLLRKKDKSYLKNEQMFSLFCSRSNQKRL